MSTALLVGCNGQDGRYLSCLLERKGYTIVGIGRDNLDIRDSFEVLRLMAEVQPREVYYLAAFHQSAEGQPADDHDLISQSFEINTWPLNHFLCGIMRHCPDSRLFYAASSHVFGNAYGSPQDEATPIGPICPYGISKAAGIQVCRYYRSQGVHASVGILYNHESPLRPPQFISRKIARAAARAKSGERAPTAVGSLEAKVDWGCAQDYVDAMWRILQLDRPDDFVIASGELHTVREFAQVAFDVVGLNWEQFVVEDSSLLRKTRMTRALRGDSGKLRHATGWRPQVSFDGMIKEMVEQEMLLLEAENG